tara:strand:- start:304 stop:480 length:177 start_codon:yes stop_codon:yes gene_type:complete
VALHRQVGIRELTLPGPECLPLVHTARLPVGILEAFPLLVVHFSKGVDIAMDTPQELQ